MVERASPLSTSPCRHPRLTGRHRACRDVASARTIDRQFESGCGSDRTSCRPSPLSLLSGISTATLYHYIHTYYILYLISGRLTLHWCQNCLTFALCFAFLSFSSVFFSFYPQDRVWRHFWFPDLDLETHLTYFIPVSCFFCLLLFLSFLCY